MTVDPAPGSRPRVSASRLIHPTIVVVAAFIALAVFAHLGAWAGDPAEKIQMGGGDQATYLWALRWVPYALTHGHNPFYSDFLNYPAGVNLLDNTGSFLLAIVATPITLVWGAIASYNVLQTLAFVCSAFAAYTLLRRWTSWWPAAFAGGLLYGFSPFMVAAGWTHLFLIFAAAPPLILLCLDEVMVRQAGPAAKWGLVLGALVVAQFFISPEMLANTVELCVVGVFILLIAYRGHAKRKLRHAATAVLSGTALAGLVLAYPIWFTLWGPQHVSVKVPAEVVSSDLLAPIVPNSNLLFTPAAVRVLGDSFSGPVAFMGRNYVIAGVGYLGLPLLVLLIYFIVRYWALATVRLFGLMSTVAFVASLGPTLHIGTRLTGIKMPERLLIHVPILNATAPYRYALFVPLGAAVILAVGLDRLRDGIRQTWTPAARRLLLAGITIAALAPLIPVLPYSVMDVRTPQYFRSTAASAIPSGSVLVTYPFPGPLSAETMVWQAQNDFRWRIVGGYENLPDGRGGFTHQGNPSVTSDLLNQLAFGATVPIVTPKVRQGILDDLRNWHATIVAVDMSVTGSTAAVALFDDILASQPHYQQGIAVWDRLPFGHGQT